jgi:hypothetical protein
MLLPYPLNSHSTDSLRFGHATYAPVRRIQRSGMECCLDHGVNFPFRDFRNTTWTRSILFQTTQPKRQKTLSPKLNCGPGNFKSLSNLFAGYSICCQLNDLSTLNQSRRNASSSRPSIQNGTLFSMQYNGLCCSSHEQQYIHDRALSQVIYGTVH